MNYMDYYMNGSKKLGAPEESYLYSSSEEMSPQKSYLGGADMASSSGGGAEAAGMGSAAAGGAMMGGPVGAGVAVGGQFLTNYMAQKAADERQRRATAAQIENEYAQNQNKGFDTMMRAWGGALR